MDNEKIFCEQTEKPELSEDTLTHFGIKGMRWGFRRRRNRRNRNQNWGQVTEGTGRGTGSWESQSRRRAGYQGQTLKYKPVGAMQNYDSAMYGDSRYERQTGAINVTKDKRFQRQGSGINYDKDVRFQRQTNGIDVFRDPRYHGPYKRWRR